jgi:hypothetical protein
MTLCKLTGQAAPDNVAPELAVTDLMITPDPATPRAPCGNSTGSSDDGRTGSDDGSGLPGVLPPLVP